MDYDLEKIYVDSIYKVIDLSIDDLIDLSRKLSVIREKFGTRFYINVDYRLEDMPEELKDYCIELEL